MKGTPGKPDTPPAQSKWFYGAVAVSLLLHAVLIMALVRLANMQPHDPEEATVMVDLVPPPEPEEPELALDVPEYEVSEQQDSEAPPPPPPPPPPAEDLSQDEEPQAQSASQLPVMKPVIEYGETDSGPRIDRDGASNRETSDTESDVPEQTDPGVTDAEEQQNADTASQEARQDDAPELPEEQKPDLPESSESTIESILAAEADASPDASDTVEPKTTLVTPAPEPEQEPVTEARQGSGTPEELPEVKELLSDAAVGNPRVQTAMENLPRSKRAGILCMTEMRSQLLASSPPYPPEILPSYALPAGTVLESHQAAFRSQGKWFDLAFRCEVNEDVTKVLKFSYRVGNEIPREEWSQRGFPSF